MNYLIGLVLSSIAGVLGRMGGAASYHTVYRDIGVPSCMLAFMWIVHGFHWTLLLCFGLMYGSCTTYFKKKGTDSKWYNWAFVGLAFSLAMLPWAIHDQNWLGFGLRSVFCTAGIVAWCLAVGNDVREEFGRYFIVIATLLFL